MNARTDSTSSDPIPCEPRPAAVRDARSAIESIDKQIVALLAERMQSVAKIGAEKAAEPDRSIVDPAREQHVAELWQREAEQRGLPPHFAARVLREVLGHSHRDQERQRRRSAAPAPARVGYQGEPGCYSDLGVDRLFHARGSEPKKAGYRSFAALLDALEGGELDYALLPVENSICGAVGEAVQLLTERALYVVDEELVDVDHHLAALPGATLADLRTVRSHPVALLQCQRLLRSLPEVEAHACYDTAAAALEVQQRGDRSVAAICSVEAARRAGLELLREHVADHAENQTRLVLLAREPEPRERGQGPCKTSLCFEVQHRRGALVECLQVFAEHGVDMSRIESRPIPDRPWQYAFVVDLAGHGEDPEVAAAIDELRRRTGSLRVLGSYPDRGRATPKPERVRRSAPVPAAMPVAPGAPEPAAVCAAPPAKAGATPLAAHGERVRRSVVQVGDVPIGGEHFTLIAGPCAVENVAQVQDAAALVHRHGAQILRGGVFKPRSSPYSFQGLGLAGLELLVEAGRRHGMPVVTEVMCVDDVAAVAEHADMLQIGARNMQNFPLLQAVGRTRRPVLLKRGMSATIDELLLAAEYVLREGNQRVVLCERGIRTFEKSTRSTLDVSAVPVLRQRTHLPILVDPSHAAGRRDLVVPLALAAVAAGADGLIVEAHPRPEEALCDKDQALTEADMAELAAGIKRVLGTESRRW